MVKYSVQLSEAEFLTQVYLAHIIIGQYGFRLAFRKNLAVIENVGVIANAERFPDVVVGDQDTNIQIRQVRHDFLDLDN
jgi:hypothetical protein